MESTVTLKERYGLLRTQIHQFFEFYRRVKEAEAETRATAAKLVFAERDIEMLKGALATQHRDPLRMAKNLLEQADEIMAEPVLNSYELRAWRAEYRNFKLDEQRANY
jgi:hypothetical protein